MTLDVLVELEEEPLQPVHPLHSRVLAHAWREHSGVVLGTDVLLVCNHCIEDFGVQEHFPRRGLLGFELHNSEAVGVGPNALEVVESGPNDVLDPEGALEQELDHCERLGAVLLRY